jgi:hypothetical protein
MRNADEAKVDGGTELATAKMKGGQPVGRGNGGKEQKIN